MTSGCCSIKILIFARVDVVTLRTISYIGYNMFFSAITLQTAAELERRRENFTKELDFVFADVVWIFHDEVSYHLYLMVVHQS